ncbi:MAG: penicillin-binding protein 1B [Gammaproteobacteria bacterium]|nr:penicillin-binding protein 1B [Gammaproteobacteria bacterium]
MAARRRSKRKPTTARRTRRSFPLLQLLVVVIVAAAGYLAYLDIIVREQFEGKRWALPARVFARPLELYAGRALAPEQLTQELDRLGYHSVRDPQRPGEYSRNGTRFQISTRGFTFWDGADPPQQLAVEFSGDWITALGDRVQHKDIDLARLDPLQIASIYPSKQEDRQLVQLAQVPPLLIQTLMAVEDRTFYEHHGISPKSLLRATVANVRAGGVVQGGSTLTQQLVKNFFLSNERTVQRKLNEAGMALLLEVHYSKDEILEAYLNEVYLGQDGSRAVHGVGLASYFYFERPLDQLEPEQFALLVGMIKGPSYYDPRRHPERAKLRRDLVLDTLVEQGILTAEQGTQAKARPLGALQRPSLAVNAHPAFLDMVRRQLRSDYREEDLTSEGLRIFTTLDPLAQHAAEDALTKRLARIERDRGLKADTLQGALVATAIDSGEVLALVGDRNPRMAGFNRVLDAARPIGSLVKPAVYLTALMQPERYTLASQLEDTPLRMKAGDGRIWTPENYDRQYRGQVLLFDALVHSYNVPTVRLGLDIGPERVVDTLRKLGVQGELKAYPALMLGAADLTLMDVTRLYQTLAAGGFRSPLRAIRAVLAVDDTPLQSYPLKVEQVLDADQVFLVNATLQAVATEGTAKALGARFGVDAGIAGKTGTTNDKRDSWFAGFTGNQLAVTWVGRDDNKSMGLSGASGAVPIWSDYMAELGVQPLTLPSSERIEWVWIDRGNGLRADTNCADRVQLPFIVGSTPQAWSSCARGELSKPIEWLKGLIR